MIKQGIYAGIFIGISAGLIISHDIDQKNAPQPLRHVPAQITTFNPPPTQWRERDDPKLNPTTPVPVMPIPDAGYPAVPTVPTPLIPMGELVV